MQGCRYSAQHELKACTYYNVISHARFTGSNNSMTALMTVAQTEEAEEAKSAGAATAFTRPPLELRSFSLESDLLRAL